MSQHERHLTCILLLHLFAAAAGLCQLRQLSLGWCRDLGDTRQDSSNNIGALASLVGLQELSLAGTRVCDGQLAAVLPQLTNMQVSCAALLEPQGLQDILHCLSALLLDILQCSC